MIALREGVQLHNLSPQIVLAIVVADQCHTVALEGKEETFGTLPDMVVTSVADGKHRPGSLHYRGEAVDIRTRHLSRVDANYFAEAVSEALGAEYDVVLERDPPHLHIEYDPKLKRGKDDLDPA